MAEKKVEREVMEWKKKRLVDFCVSQGWSFIPVKEKKPLVSWKEFQERKPTGEEIDKWLASFDFDRVGIICGKVSGKDGLSLEVIDIDAPQYYEFFKDINTRVHRTPSGGYHLLFYSKVENKRTPKFKGFPIDLLGKKGFFIFGAGYKVEKDYPILTIEDTKELLRERLPKLDESSYPEKTDDFRKRLERFKSQINIEDVLQYYGARNIKRIGHYVVCRCPFDEGKHEHNSIINQDTYYCFTEGKLRDAIDLVREKENCSFWEAIEKLEEMCGVKFERKKSRKFEEVSEEEIEGNILLYQGKKCTYIFTASDGYSVPASNFFLPGEKEALIGELTYLSAIKKTKEGSVEESVPVLVIGRFKEGILVKREYYPLREIERLKIEGKFVRLEMKGLGVNFPETLLQLETLQRFVNGEEPLSFWEIFERLKSRIAKFVDFSFNPVLCDIVVCWAMSTYFYDIFTAYPILFIYGVFGSGKTRLLKAVIYSSHKGYLVIDPSPASLFRTVDIYRPTLGVDEFTKLIEDILRIVRSAYKKGERVPRIEKVLKGNKFILSLFETYCPVALVSTEMLPEMLLSRCISITMEKGDDSKLEDRDPEPYDFSDIREELYLSRLTKSWEVYQRSKELKIPLGGRAKEIWRPILVVASLVSNEVYEQVLRYAIESIARQAEELYSEEKLLIESIEKCLLAQYEAENIESLNGDLTLEFTSSELLKYLKEILKGEGLSDARIDRMWSAHRVGRKLTALALNKKRVGKERKRTYIITVQELKELKEKFGLADIKDIRDINLESIGKGSEHTENKNGLKTPEKLQNFEVFGASFEKPSEKDEGIVSKKMSEMSLMSANSSDTTFTTSTICKEEAPQQEKEAPEGYNKPADLEPEIESYLIKIPNLSKVTFDKVYKDVENAIRENCRRKGISFDKDAFDTAFRSVWSRHRKDFIYAPNCPEEYKADSPEETLKKIAEKFRNENPNDYEIGIPERELKREFKKAFQGPPEKWIEYFRRNGWLYESKEGFWKII